MAERRTAKQLYLRDLLVTYGQTRGLGFDVDTSLRYAENVAKLPSICRSRRQGKKSATPFINRS
jgi:hypothetical protein